MKLSDVLNEDEKYSVDFEYQMPGWDEFGGKTDISTVEVYAKDKKDAEKQFWKLQRFNKDRNALKFALSVEKVTPAKEHAKQYDEAMSEPTSRDERRAKITGDHNSYSTLKGKDVIRIDVPTLIRMLEWAREDVKHDETLHEFVTKLLEHPKSVVTMKEFNKIMVDFK